MNREIKFRAWDKEYTDEDGDIYGGDMYYSEIDYDKRKLNLVSFNIGNSGYNEDMIFMQSTGLKDKNGKEIYEGDIFRNGVLILWVSYRNTSFTLDCNDYQCVCALSDFYNVLSLDDLEHQFVVIGNIYENQELLENK